MAQLHYGFEREFFVQNQEGDYIIVPSSLPKDDCGWLAEARTAGGNDLIEAVSQQVAAEFKLAVLAKEVNVILVNEVAVKLPPRLLRIAMQRFGKEPVDVLEGNLYGKAYSLSDKYCRAGFHVHISNDGHQLDIPKIVSVLDNNFRQEIKDSRRLPGSYKIAPVHCGFEYRSLPATIKINRVYDLLKQIEQEMYPSETI